MEKNITKLQPLNRYHYFFGAIFDGKINFFEQGNLNTLNTVNTDAFYSN